MSAAHSPDIVPLSVRRRDGRIRAVHVYSNKNSSENEIVSDKEQQFADVLGAHFDKPWVKSVASMVDVPEDERPAVPWPHELEGVCIPMPEGDTLHEMKREFYQRARGQQLGPVTAKWREQVFAWAAKLRKRLFGATKQVTGLWSLAKERFRSRLQVLQDHEVSNAIMSEVEDGVRMPFAMRPLQPIVAKTNHPDLSKRAQHVFNALCEQLEERSIEPFDMSKGIRPMGVLSLRWVAKTDPSVVRLTLNGRPFNPFFPGEACVITLETHRELRTQFQYKQMYVGFDLHNGFFNQQYHEDDRRWVCFRIHRSELAPEHVRFLKKRFPTSWVGGYVYFSYRGLVMGLGPSCQQLSRVNLAMLRVWRRFVVKGISWDATSYIDDLMAWINGLFEGALELSLRLLAEQLCLGYSVNLNHKSIIVPTYYYCHIGICINSVTMRFSLPQRRVLKLRKSVRCLQAVTKVGKSVSAKAVARLVGQLWSINVVCYRAVAIMARGLIQTLAKMIRSSEAMDETNPNRLRYILRRVWGGNVMWTKEAQSDLDFWMKVDFAALSAAISNDAWQQLVDKWVVNPTSGELAQDVKVFAVDTSNTMSGGGEFWRDGDLWCMRGNMAVRLTEEEILTSSTMRELLGVLRLDLTLIPASCKRAIVALDNQAAVWALRRGSRVPAIQAVVRAIYLRQITMNRVLWPVWVRRSEFIIQQCDARSRLVDNHAYSAPADVFWRANQVAIGLWGRGFQVDACADLHNVQPVDRRVKLPFYSRWASPHASATDMLQQRWKGFVNWCYPPFALLTRVFALLREQQACAAILAPASSYDLWGRSLRMHARNVLRVLHVRPFGCCGSPRLAVFFLDFATRPPSSSFLDRPSVESYTRGTGKAIVFNSLSDVS